MIYLIFILFLFLRLYPYLFSPVPVGYDPGLYVYLWHHNLSIPWLKSIYPPTIYYLGLAINSPILLSFLIASILFLSVYLYTKNKWTIFLLSTSAIQYRLWWYCYLKQMLATSFIFFYLTLSKTKFKYIFPILIPLTHQPTAIIMFIILIFRKDLVSIFLFLVSLLLVFSSSYAPYLSNVSTTLGAESGTFYTLSQAIVYMLPILPLTLLAIRNKHSRLMTAMYLICFTLPLFGLFLGKRFIPYIDIFGIILAGSSISSLKIRRLFVPLYIVFIFWFVINNSAALISSDEYDEIKLLQSNSGYLLVTDNEYTPWAYGYSGLKPITPGFGEYDIYWTDSQWRQFWAGQNQVELLKKLPQPLYIWSGDKSVIKYEPAGECFTRFSWHVWEFHCQ